MLKLMAKCSPAMNVIVQDAKNPFFWCNARIFI